MEKLNKKMKDCIDCEFRGYSPQFCMFHSKQCHMGHVDDKKKLPTSVKVGATTLAGAGLGVAAVVLGTTAASLIGGTILLHAAMFKLGAGAGLAGGGVGLFKGISKKKNSEVSIPKIDDEYEE